MGQAAREQRHGSAPGWTRTEGALNRGGTCFSGSRRIYELQRRVQPVELTTGKGAEGYLLQPTPTLASRAGDTKLSKESHLKLPLHEIEARDHLSDGMLDLQSRVPMVVHN